MKKKLFFMAMVALIATTFTSCKKKDNNIVVGEAVYEELLTGDLYYAEGATVYLMKNETEYVDKTTVAADGSFKFDPAPDGSYWIDVVYSTTLYDYEGFSSDFYIEKEDYKDVGRIICY